MSYFNIINTNLVYNQRPVKTTKITSVKKKNTTPVANTSNQSSSSNIYNRNFFTKATPLQGGNIGVGLLSKFDKFPEQKHLFLSFINGINRLGYRVYIVDTVRDSERHKSMRNKHKAKGRSKHEFGLAMDINIINDRTKVQLFQNSSEGAWKATGVPDLAISLGLQWGDKRNIGVFFLNGNPMGNIDRSHFELPSIKTGLSAPTESKFEDVVEEITTMEIDREGIFQNFKVNKFSFNFFLKRRQLSEDFRKITSRLVYDNGGGLLSEVKIASPKKIN